MPLNFLGLTINDFPTSIQYLPKKVEGDLVGMKSLTGKENAANLRNALSTSTRSFRIVRSRSAVGQSPIKPLLFVESDFWNEGAYSEVLDGIASTDGTKMKQAHDPFGRAAASVATGSWATMKKGKHDGNEMIGCLLVKFAYTYTPPGSGEKGVQRDLTCYDYVVSGAANLLFDSGRRSYTAHSGKASGAQVHTEMLLASQLNAFLGTILDQLNGTTVSPRVWAGIDLAAAYEANPALSKLGRITQVRFDAGKLDIDVKVYIEKGSFCVACENTWKDLKSGLKPRFHSFHWSKV